MTFKQVFFQATIIVLCIHNKNKNNSDRLLTPQIIKSSAAKMGRVSNEIQEVLFEKRILTAVSALCGLSAVLFLASIATDYWLIVVPPAPVQDPGAETGLELLWSHGGLWRLCDVYNRTDSASASSVVFADRIIAEFRDCRYLGLGEGGEITRTVISLCVIILLLILLSAAFSVYSLIHPRYTYKRIGNYRGLRL